MRQSDLGGKANGEIVTDEYQDMGYVGQRGRDNLRS